MSRETTDTNSSFGDDIPNGTYDFEVHNVIRKDIKDKVGYEWKLDYQDEEGRDMSGKVLTWPNQIGALLAILGCKEIAKGKYEWDTDMMQGKTFKATITHDPDKKNPSKVYQNMSGFAKSGKEDDVPFG